MKTLTLTFAALVLGATAASAQPTSRTLLTNPTENQNIQVARGTEQPCTDELHQQRARIQHLIDRLNAGQSVSPAELERALRESNS